MNHAFVVWREKGEGLGGITSKFSTKCLKFVENSELSTGFKHFVDKQNCFMWNTAKLVCYMIFRL